MRKFVLAERTEKLVSATLTLTGLSCVRIDMSTNTIICPGFHLWPIEASLIRVERSRSLVQAHNSTHVSHNENSQ